MTGEPPSGFGKFTSTALPLQPYSGIMEYVLSWNFCRFIFRLCRLGFLLWTVFTVYVVVDGIVASTRLLAYKGAEQLMLTSAHGAANSLVPVMLKRWLGYREPQFVYTPSMSERLPYVLQAAQHTVGGTWPQLVMPLIGSLALKLANMAV